MQEPQQEQEKPEDGDVYCCATGEHLGTLEFPFAMSTPEGALHIQICRDGKWHIYQLHAVQEMGDHDA